LDKEIQDAVRWAHELQPYWLAALAGFIKYLQRFLTKPAPPWEWSVVAIQVLTSILAGKVTSLVCHGAKIDPDYTTAAVALAGWGGAKVIEFLSKKLGTNETTP
jgi:hypothetical protein